MAGSEHMQCTQGAELGTGDGNWWQGAVKGEAQAGGCQQGQEGHSRFRYHFLRLSPSQHPLSL